MADENAGKDDYGVLLYYKYTSIPDLEELFNFYDSNCNSLGLLGRVRLSCHGVNVTVGGKLSSLEKHIDAVGSNNLFDETDFKLASCHQPLNDKVAEQCGFTSLSIRIVKELVTFSSNPLLKSPEISNAGRHLTAAEFHSILENAGKRSGNDNPSFGNRLVLLDARNLYETRIGKFRSSNVTTLDPRVRQYSDLPSWIDSNSEKLRGNSVLMYCTGGIRCEMASAYIKSKGAGFENVFQLFGGIQRYLEQFPDGGFFKGKNFVFDHRVSVGSSNSNVLGTCLACNSLFDDYSSRSRCAYCRMLVLVCHGCQDKCSTYICELCQKNSKYILTVPVAEDEQLQEASKSIELEADSTLGHTALPLPSPSVNGTRALRKLRILCLHGFRQNASSFKGRTASLAKKLKNVAELVFINGTYELPFIYQPGHSISNCNRLAYSSSSPKSSSIKFAWFIDPNFSERSDGNWKMADGPFDSLQYQQQTDGFDASLQRLKTVFSQMGPFDGILGFSQGAAMAASVSAQQQKLKGEIDFKFVVLCSGFALNLEEHSEGSINCPSLHIFGNNEGKDRQIASQASRHLASLFKDSCRMMVKHSLGHIVPTQSPYIDNIKDFLHQFL